jgi:hypothetical protein
MMLTPRQIAAYLQFGDKLDRLDRQADLIVAAIGAQGDKKAVEKLARDLAG